MSEVLTNASITLCEQRNFTLNDLDNQSFILRDLSIYLWQTFVMLMN